MSEALSSSALQPQAFQPQASQPKPPSSNRPLPSSVEKAWNARFSSHREQDRKKFESLACQSLDEYLKKLENACTDHKNESKILRTFDWFEPLFKTVEIFSSVAGVVINAHPNPSAFVLGGIVAVVQITSRLLQYQKLTVRMLTRMGMKARALAVYENELYKNDEDVQRCIINVAGDVLEFCLKAVDFLSENGQVRAKVKHLALMILSDYDARLGKEVDAFELHVEELETSATLCDKRRVQNILESQAAHRRETEKIVTQIQDQHSELRMELFNKQQVLEQQKQQRNQRKNKERLLDWLSPLNFKNSYEQRRRNHLPGTGSWLLSSARYRHWRSVKESDLLWIKGKPGCGKSILAALAIMDIELDLPSDTALAYAICQRDSQDKQSQRDLLGALAKQVAEDVPDIDAVLESQYAASRRETTAGRIAVEAVLGAAMAYLSEVYIVIDGLDECKEYVELVEELQQLMSNSRSRIPIKVMIFSRPDSILEKLLGGCQQINPVQFNNEDVESYVHSRFPEDKTEASRTIREECVKKADGMFLWVKLMADMLDKRPLTDKQKLKRINGIPPQLGSMYDAVLEEIWSQDEDARNTAFRVLLWTTNAHIPLSGWQMLDAAADFGGAPALDELDRHSRPEDLITLCGNLIFIDANGDIRLIHESVRNYLDDPNPKARPLQTYKEQAVAGCTYHTTVCLQYLLLDDFNEGPKRTKAQVYSCLRKYPFLRYAARYWTFHIPEEVDETLRLLMSRFVRSVPHRELSMQVSIFDSSYGQELWNFAGSSSEVHIVAFYGLRMLVDSLLGPETVCNASDGRSTLPITYARTGFHREMVVWLIGRSRTPDGLAIPAYIRECLVIQSADLGWIEVLETLLSDDSSLISATSGGRSPLMIACMSNQLAVVDILIRHGADLSWRDPHGGTALTYAVINKNLNIVQKLLLAEADTSLQDDLGCTALHYAADINLPAYIEPLLKNGGKAVRLAKDRYGKTALHVAAQRDAVDVLKQLLLENSDIELRSTDGSTILQTAALYGSTRSARELISRGIDVDVANDYGETALITAASSEHVEIVRLLVDAGCDVEKVTEEGHTAVHRAAWSRKLLLLTSIRAKLSALQWEALVQRHADNGQTPLHVATIAGHEAIVNLLLDAQPDADTRDYAGMSALHYAADLGHEHLCGLLLQRTKDPNPRTNDNDTPIHRAAGSGNLGFLKCFFKESADLGLHIDQGALDKDGNSAFWVALDKGHESVAEFLMDQGCISVVIDMDGNLPHHHAAWYGMNRILRNLLLLHAEGAKIRGFRGQTPMCLAAGQNRFEAVDEIFRVCPESIDIPDDDGNTPVMAALQYGKTGRASMASHLLDLGANADTININNDTLLHGAVEAGDVELVKRLLDLGCRVDVVNSDDRIPLQYAVIEEHLEIVKILLHQDPQTACWKDQIGQSLTILAARTGDVDLLRMVSSDDSWYTVASEGGWTVAAEAASFGHLEIIEYLAQKKIPLHVPNLCDVTSLMEAAEHGYTATVQYLIGQEPSHLNDCDTLGYSALTKAVMYNKPASAQILLRSGSRPDALTSEALQHMAFDSDFPLALRPSPLETGHTERVNALIHVVRRSCEAMLAFPRELSARDSTQRDYYILHLAQSLNILGNYPFASLCFMEIYRPPQQAIFRLNYFCELCGSKGFKGNIYVCKVCNGETPMCQSCFDERSSGGRLKSAAWQAREAAIQLEKHVQPLRLATSSFTSIAMVGSAVNMFEVGRTWVARGLEDFESWERQFAHDGKFGEMEHPGKEFLEIMTEWKVLDEKPGAQDGVREAENELNKRYNVQRRRFRADEEIVDSRCEHHEFLLISEEEHAKAKSEGRYFDTESERLSNEFIREILSMYSGTENSKHATSGVEEELPEGMPTTTPPETTLKASQITQPALRDSLRRGSAANLPLAVANLSLKDASTKLSLFSPHRARTLPAKLEEASGNGNTPCSALTARFFTPRAGETPNVAEEPDVISPTVSKMTKEDSGHAERRVQQKEEEESAFERRVEAAFWLQDTCHGTEEKRTRWFLAVKVLRAMSTDLAEEYLTNLEESRAEEDG